MRSLQRPEQLLSLIGSLPQPIHAPAIALGRCHGVIAERWAAGFGCNWRVVLAREIGWSQIFSLSRIVHPYDADVRWPVVNERPVDAVSAAAAGFGHGKTTRSTLTRT